MGARGRRRAVAPYQMRPLGLGGRPRAAVQLDGPSQAERGVSMKIAPMKIAVVGAGAIGGYFGGLLARAGHDVTLIARGAHRDAIRSRGLTVNSKDDSFTVKPACTENPAEAGPQEAVKTGKAAGREKG